MGQGEAPSDTDPPTAASAAQSSTSTGWRHAVALILLGTVLLVSPYDPLSAFDQAAEAWFSGALRSSTSAYATVRLLNASVSVLAESDLQVEPAGVGVSIAVGQVLDPLDDMAERFSDVVVVALVALGLQKVLHHIAAELATAAVGGLLLALGFSFFLRGRPTPRMVVELRRVLVGGVTLLLAFRLAAPMSAVVGQGLYDRFLAEDIEAARVELREGLVELEAIVALDVPADDGWFGAVRSAGRFVQTRVDALKTAISRLRPRLDDLVSALLTLTGLYTVQVILQGVLLPLATFGATWLLSRIVLRSLLGGRV